jgi:hypothetical protein
VPTGTATSYDLTIGVVVNMDEAIYMLSPQDTPLLTGLGADGLTMIGAESVDQRQFSWMTDTILTPRSTIAGNVVTADVFITVAVNDRIKFSTGDVIYIGEQNTVEQIRVTGYGVTNDTLLVTRGWSGTPSAYTSGASVLGLGTALIEGSDPEAARYADRVEATNVTQIFGPTKVDLSRTEQQVRKYGVGSEFSHQIMSRVAENAISREQAFVYGAKVDSTSARIRTTGGLRHFIVSNADASATSLTVTTLTSRQQIGWDAGGFADVVMGNPRVVAALNAAADTSVVRESIDDPMRGRTRVEWVDTEFGSVLIARNRWMLNNDAIGFSRSNVTRRVLQPLVFERLAKTGDSDEAHIVCEEGLEVKGEQHCFKFTNLGY